MNRLRTGCSWGGEELSWHIYRNWFFVTWQVNSFHFNPEKQKNSPHPQDSHQIAKWHTYFRHLYSKVYLHCYIANYVRWFPVHHRLKREGRSLYSHLVSAHWNGWAPLPLSFQQIAVSSPAHLTAQSVMMAHPLGHSPFSQEQHSCCIL